MKKMLRWTAVIGGVASMCTGIVFGGLSVSPLYAMIRFGFVAVGMALFVAGLIGIARGPKKQKYQEWDYRDAYVDELEARRKSQESWDSIKRAQE